MRPWRLVVFIVLFVVFLLFIIFNLENKSVIRFGPTEAMATQPIPVFLIIFVSFVAGMLCTFPFVFRPRKKAGDVKGKGLLVKAAGKQVDSLADKSHYGID